MNPEKRMRSQEDFDRWLDVALRARSDVEPRLGLESRVLARLAANSQRSRSGWWVLPIAAAMALVIAVIVVGLHRVKEARTMADRQQPPSISQPSPPQVAAQENGTRVVNKGGRRPYFRAATALAGTTRTPEQGVRRSGPHSDPSGHELEPLPKLATFPAPRPETAEERMLLWLAARRESYDLAASSTDAAPLRDLSVPEINIDPMEGTPPDKTPRE